MKEIKLKSEENKMSTPTNRSARRGMNPGELLALIAIFAVLSAILAPVIHHAQQQSPMKVCASNMERLGVALNLYAEDWDFSFPPNRSPDRTHPGPAGLDGSENNWKRSLLNNGYLKDRQVFFCPSNPYHRNTSDVNGCMGDESNCVGANKGVEERQLPISYAMNGAAFHETNVSPPTLQDIAHPNRLILLLESRSGFTDLGDWAVSLVYGHPVTRRANWLFVDGTVKPLKIAQTLEPVYLWRMPQDRLRSATPQLIPPDLR